jgi:hypothetical protein
MPKDFNREFDWLSRRHIKKLGIDTTIAIIIEAACVSAFSSISGRSQNRCLQDNQNRRAQVAQGFSDFRLQ